MNLRPARTLLAATLLLSLLVVPGLPLSAAEVTSVHYVPTQLPDGTTEHIRVEVRRDAGFDAQWQGVLATMSPYNLTPTGTGVGAGMSGEGIAQAQIDVLGTRGSTGCWDYGGFNEMKAGVDAVRFLAGDIPDREGAYLKWSNGRVGLTGVSYDGTTATMVASAPREMWVDDRADSIDVDGTTPLKAIVPVAAISHWYGYAFSGGMRFFLNSESATDEGFDTPLAFDFGFGRTVHADEDESVTDRAAECGSIAHTMQAYSRNPDYTEFWQERDYALRPGEWTTNTLIVHGWNDYNVKQYEATRLFEALAPHADDPTTDADDEEGRFDLRLWMTQSRHANGGGEGYATLRDSFFRAHLLEGAAAEAAAEVVESFPHVRSQGQTFATAGDVAYSQTWPLEGTTTHTLFLNRTYEQDLDCAPVCVPGPGTGEVGELSYTNRYEGPLAGRSGSYGATSGWLDTGVTGEEVAANDPWSNDGQKLDVLGGQGYYSLAFATTPLIREVQIAGSAVLEGYYSFIAADGAGLTPILVAMDPGGDHEVIQRGFLNTDYREGLASSAGTASGWVRADVRFLPEDYTVPEGHRIGVILTSSNSVWAVAGTPAGFVSVGLAPDVGGLETATGTVLHLPLVDVAPDEQVFDDWPSPE
jgi:X-Pro dipeptidyl-peptidase